MCGRFMLTAPPDVLIAAFSLPADSLGIGLQEPLRARYNIAPDQKILTLRTLGGSSQSTPAMLHWGLVPSWAKEKKVGYRMINARCETLASKASFRTSFKQRRCLVLADGFYEWQQRGRQKQPYCFRLEHEDVFAFAGLWDSWQDNDGSLLESCTIVTTTANELVQPVHERMPVILPRHAHEQWLDSSCSNTAQLQSLLQPYPAEAMHVYPVSTLVGNVANDDERCAQALAEQQALLL